MSTTDDAPNVARATASPIRPLLRRRPAAAAWIVSGLSYITWVITSAWVDIPIPSEQINDVVLAVFTAGVVISWPRPERVRLLPNDLDEIVGMLREVVDLLKVAYATDPAAGRKRVLLLANTETRAALAHVVRQMDAKLMDRHFDADPEWN